VLRRNRVGERGGKGGRKSVGKMCARRRGGERRSRRMGMMRVQVSRMIFFVSGLFIGALGVSEGMGRVALGLLAHPPDDQQSGGEDEEGEDEAGDEDRDGRARGESWLWGRGVCPWRGWRRVGLLALVEPLRMMTALSSPPLHPIPFYRDFIPCRSSWVFAWSARAAPRGCRRVVRRAVC